VSVSAVFDMTIPTVVLNSSRSCTGSSQGAGGRMRGRYVRILAQRIAHPSISWKCTVAQHSKKSTGSIRTIRLYSGNDNHHVPPTSLPPPVIKKTPTPVRILDTARSAAKVRPPVSPGSSTFNSISSVVQLPNTGNTVSVPTTTTTATATAVLPQHPAHHFMDGGMPCDPAPPRYALAEYGEESLYTLILLRHGESEWNSQNRYTGWCDVDLTQIGRQEARTAGRLLYENQIEIDQAFTSVLKRASFSCNMALNAAHQHWVPVTKTWRLNERHYGALQGYNKDTAWTELGLDQELVMQMRRAYATRPPIMQNDHPFWHGHDRRYRKLTPQQLDASRAESLKDAADRILPFFNSVITPSIQSGKKCLIVSHANTIRTLVKHIDGISDEDIKGMTIPTGIPLLYRLDKNMKPVDPQIELEFRYMVEPKGYVLSNRSPRCLDTTNYHHVYRE
jgi:2,3-bisphosphoglycerate-dependent phosphoglycerate mutase